MKGTEPARAKGKVRHGGKGSFEGHELRSRGDKGGRFNPKKNCIRGRNSKGLEPKRGKTNDRKIASMSI